MGQAAERDELAGDSLWMTTTSAGPSRSPAT